MVSFSRTELISGNCRVPSFNCRLHPFPVFTFAEIFPFMYRFFLYILICAAAAGCSPNNVKTDASLGKFFTDNGVNGCFALFNNGTGNFTVHNLDRYKDSGYIPASTFKIVNALIGLQTGAITDEKMVIKWDGKVRENPEWNRDLTMYEAFRVSAVPYFQEVARRIGREKMQFWLDSLSYGTKKIKTTIDSFWLDRSLTITPDEELGLVKKLYFNQLPFYKVYQETVKRAMLFEDKPEYRLSYKTGWSGWDSVRKDQTGWVVGWIEENKHPYFFVLNLSSNDPAFKMREVRMKMLKGILDHLGFMKGQK
jgi:beta-lactamase class D